MSPLPGLLAACSVALACAVLSVFVVSRRWAFIGEGISHSGFGGAGTAWLLALAFPALDRPWVPYVGVVVFCLCTALAIGYLDRSRRINSDAAIGIFLVASLAWGFVAQRVYSNVHNGAVPAGWDTFLFGDMQQVTARFAIPAAVACLAAVAVVAMLGKELLYYCFDPAMAEASGVRAGFVHYLLILLVTLMIIIGARVVGPLLVTALLILPGATGLLLSSRFRATLIASIVISLSGALVGLFIHLRWPFLPTGPAMVLALFAEFLVVFAWAKSRRA
jgi:manganese/iron transport system permease protein